MHHKTLVVTPIHVHPESRLVDWGTIIINNSPSRSQLIGLKPLGEGTAQIESFFSYLLRLADAHAVRLVDLVKFVIKPLIKNHSNKDNLSGTIGTLQRGICGSHVTTLEALTLHPNLHHLTLSPAKALNCTRVDYKCYRAWCPACIRQDETPYERLIWQVKGVSYCPTHGTPLENTCPHCKCTQDHSRTTVSIKNCCHCGLDRIFAPRANIQLIEEERARSNECVQFIIWSMLRHSNTAVALSIFQSNLVTYAKVAGGWKPLGLILGVPATSFSAWKRGLGVPELEKASSLAWYGSIGLVDLFERKLNESEIQLRIISNPLRNTRQYRQSNKDKTIDQFINLLDTRIKAQPYDKISAKQILIEIGLGPGNKLSRNEVFLQRLIAHNQTVRKFRRIAAVWIAYTDLRAATIKVAESGRRLERNIISKKMHVPYRLLIPRNRQIHRRLMALVNQGRPLPEPSSRFQSKIQAYLSSNKPIEAIH